MFSYVLIIYNNVYNGERCEGENDLSRSKANSNLTVKMNGCAVDGVERGVARRQNKKFYSEIIPLFLYVVVVL